MHLEGIIDHYIVKCQARQLTCFSLKFWWVAAYHGVGLLETPPSGSDNIDGFVFCVSSARAQVYNMLCQNE